jgi:hypothetical protein
MSEGFGIRPLHSASPQEASKARWTLELEVDVRVTIVPDFPLERPAIVLARWGRGARTL